MRRAAFAPCFLVAVAAAPTPLGVPASAGNQSQVAPGPEANARQKLAEALSRHSGKFRGFTDAAIIATALRKDSRKRRGSPRSTLTSSDPAAGISAQTGLKELARDSRHDCPPRKMLGFGDWEGRRCCLALRGRCR